MASKNTMSDRNLVSKGTSSDDNPTPGFVLKELVNSTFAGPKNCKDLVGLLVPRLKKSDPNIKLKALKIINYLIVNGRVDFQKEMSAHHQLIKDCLSFTGPLDPLKGDAVYVAIQTTAKETIDNLFNETLRNRTNFTRPVDSFAGASVSSQPQPGMQGIGGGSRAPAAPKDDWLSRAKGTFGGNPAAPAQPAQPALAAPGPFGQPQPTQPQPTGRYGAAPAQPAMAAPAQPAQPAQQARAGGMFARKPAAAPAPVPAAPAYQPPVIKAGTAVTDGSYERKLVEELCTPQGMRPEPPKDKLARFAGACQTLDAAVVGPILLGKLSDKNWKVVMKALYTIQEILNTPNTDGFKAYFKENTEELQALGSYNHPMVKKMAGTVFDRVSRCRLGAEGEEEEEPEESFAAAPAPVAAAAPADFDFFGAAPAPAQPAAAPAPVPAAPASSDPFGFNATSIDDAFSGLSAQPAPAAAPAAAPVSNDPFGFNAVSSIDDAFSGLSAQPAAQAPARQTMQQPQQASFDFFGTPAQPQQPAMNYGMPAQQPQQPAMNYGMPAQQPAMNYGMPAQQPQQPAMNYGMPAQQPQQQASTMNFDFFGM